VKKYVRFGSSPRGAQAVLLGAKVRALRAGRFSPSFEDVRQTAPQALRHRLLLNFEGEADGVEADDLLGGLLQSLPEG
jgi:MoxR-like ATPase